MIPFVSSEVEKRRHSQRFSTSLEANGVGWTDTTRYSPLP
jgi:hypothetical protein